MSLLHEDWGCLVVVTEPASFLIVAAAAVAWANRCLQLNLSYFRLRRELFEEFTAMLTVPDGEPVVNLTDEQFIVVRTFLTSRNDGLNDDKRLAFDKTIMEIRVSAMRAIARSVVPPPAPGIRGMLGL